MFTGHENRILPIKRQFIHLIMFYVENAFIFTF